LVRDTVGAYALITPDYEKKGYPFDLWLEWNSNFFDKMAVISYGETKIDLPENVEMKCIPPPNQNNWQFYTIGKKLAQDMLDTDWKVLLDTDEFISARMITDKLDKTRTYALKFHHLYGNVNSEIVGVFPEYYFRVHTGNREVVNDGGSVSGKKDWGKISLRSLLKDLILPRTSIRDSIDELLYLVKVDGLKRVLFEPLWAGEVYHTNTLRDPEILKTKWKEQSMRTLNEGKSMKKHDSLDSSLKDDELKFDYSAYKKIWKFGFLKSVSNEMLPEIILRNKSRFNWHSFSEDEYLES
jgi:hypothetical protein